MGGRAVKYMSVHVSKSCLCFFVSNTYIAFMLFVYLHHRVWSMEGLPRVGFICLLGVPLTNCSAGWAQITYTIQSNQSTSTKASQTR